MINIPEKKFARVSFAARPTTIPIIPGCHSFFASTIKLLSVSESVKSKFNGSCAADGEANMRALRVKAIPKQECVICMQHQETEMRLLRSGHRPLCAGCLVEWLNAQASSQAAHCPMCREQGEG